MASTGKRSAQDLTGVDGDIVALEGNGWVVVRTTDGSETLRVQQRYLEKRSKDQGEVKVPCAPALCPMHGHGLACKACAGTACAVSVSYLSATYMRAFLLQGLGNTHAATLCCCHLMSPSQ